MGSDPGTSNRKNGRPQAASEVTREVDRRIPHQTGLPIAEARQVFLLNLADELRPLTTSNDIAAVASARLGEWLEADRTFYGELAGSRLTVERDYTHGVASLVGEHSLASLGPEMLTAYRESTIIVVNDVEADARLGADARGGLRGRQVRAYIDLVLFKEDRWVSLLAVQSATPRKWTSAEETLVREVGERVRSAIERARAEAARRESEERFRLIVESARDYAIFTIDDTGLITSWPPGAEAVFGWSEAEVIGRSVDVTFVPEDVAAGVPQEERATAAREGFAPNVREHLRKDGSRIFIDGSTRPLASADAGSGGFIKIGQDVTERRRAEERLRTLIQGIPQLVWRSGRGGRWTWSSPQWQAFTGQTLEESLGLGWLDALHPDDREVARSAWVDTKGADPLAMEARICHRDERRYRWFATRATPVRDAQGCIVEWLGTSTDVDDLRQMQERQEVMVAELQHRTRNLLGVVQSVAKQTLRTSVTLKDFEAAFTDRLSALSRVQGLLSRSDQEPITMRALIHSELDALGAAHMPERVIVQGPEVRLRKGTVQTLALALHELATNARKYGALANDRGRLRATWRTYVDGDGRRLALEWRETEIERTQQDGIPVTRPGGYGRSLIERALPYALRARTTYELDDAGLLCGIDLPLDENGEREDRA